MTSDPSGSHSSKSTARWLPIVIICAILAAWSLVQMVGAVLGEYGQYEQFGRSDPSSFIARYKALLVAGSMAAFLGMWLLALWFRARRQRRSG